jgi:hypothetical protein
MYFLQEKESLITELRKELRLSNEEHRELLARVNADDVIRRIRYDRMMKQFYFYFPSETPLVRSEQVLVSLLFNVYDFG